MHFTTLDLQNNYNIRNRVKVTKRIDLKRHQNNPLDNQKRMDTDRLSRFALQLERMS